MTELSQHAVEMLSRAGWNARRALDATDARTALAAEGFPPFPAVTEFLSVYGGLEIRNPDALPPAAEDWYFDARRAIRDGASLPYVTAYVRRLGTPLAPVGFGFRGYMLFMMDESGRVYGGYDDFLARVGSSGVDAINALCEGRRLTAIDG